MAGSARVTKGGCRWRFVKAFTNDVADLALTLDDRHTLKRLLDRAAQGTVRSEEWEYPLSLGRGVIGELRMDIGDDKYRIMYHEPRDDLAGLLALGIMVKEHDDEGQWRQQQNDFIEVARGRLIAEDGRRL